MIENSPVVSIIMSVYNDAEYLNESVNSVLDQTLQNFEFLIVDDCSSDDSWKILTRYAEQDSRVKLLKNEQNLRLAASLNRCLDIAKGVYIARMDADDISVPHRLQTQVDYLDAHPEIALISSGVDYIDESGKSLGKYSPPIDFALLRWSLLFGSPLRHPSVCWRRQPIQTDVGEYNADNHYAEDYEFFCNVARHHKIATLPQALLKMRQRQTSVSFSKQQEQNEFAAQVTYRQFDSYFQDRSLSEQEKRNLRALLRRYSPPQLDEFAQMPQAQWQQAVVHLFDLFDCFNQKHKAEISAAQKALLFQEVERALPALMKHGFQRRWFRAALFLPIDYLRRYPTRLFSTGKTLAIYWVYYSLTSFAPLMQMMSNIRRYYYRNQQKKQYS